MIIGFEKFDERRIDDVDGPEKEEFLKLAIRLVKGLLLKQALKYNIP